MYHSVEQKLNLHHHCHYHENLTSRMCARGNEIGAKYLGSVIYSIKNLEMC